MYFSSSSVIAFSAFFSASETAFSSLNKIRMKNYADNGDKRAKRALQIAENFDRTLSTILVGNNVVNMASASPSENQPPKCFIILVLVIFMPAENRKD